MEPTSHEHLVYVLQLFVAVVNTVNLLIMILAFGSSLRRSFARAAFLWRTAAAFAVSILLAHIGIAVMDPSKTAALNFIMVSIIIFFSVLNARVADRKAAEPPSQS